MSTQLIIIIVGALLILVGIVGGIKRQEQQSDIISPTIRIPLGVVGMLLIIFVAHYYGTIHPINDRQKHIYVGNKLEIDYPVNKTQVISPLDGDKVECRILTLGVYPEGMEKDIWLLLKPTDNRYYPQSDHTNVSYKRNGEWQVITRFGGDQGEKFELFVYETDAAASEFFSATIAQWKAQLSYPGLNFEELPPGASEAERLTVTLDGHCRGVF